MADLNLFENLVRTTINSIATDRPPTEQELTGACAMVGRMIKVSEDEVQQIIKKLQKALDVTMDVGIAIEKPYRPWLAAQKSHFDFFYWNRYASYLAQDMKLPSSVISTINKVSDKVVDLAGNPAIDGNLHRRGLLLGDIQSGKTSNYIAIMNKAADVGYKVIILLTGTVESLRRQTQERVDEGFIGRSSKEYLKRTKKTIKKGVGRIDADRFATGFTTESSDFKKAVVNGLNLSLKNMGTEPVIFVMKKNARALQNLIDWLKDDCNLNSQGLIDLPLLLIDDEADNASINTRADNDPTTINKHIRTILRLFVKSSYIAVTATPFANIFILPEKNEDMENDDLFPSDYIYALDAPTNYIGSNEIFGDNPLYENSLLRIDDADAFFPYKHKQCITLTGLPESLYEALRYFLLANAARDIRGDVKAHRSMLVNVSRFVRVQEQVSALIGEWLYAVQRDITNYGKQPENVACQNKYLDSLRKMWNNPQYGFASLGKAWQEVQQDYLLDAVSGIEVRTINQRSTGKLDYTEYKDGLRVIAVGGLSLSRGLTLEGLMVSYFHRNTQMYDTLMQMGRWFGYRRGYEDLFRIWMPDDAIGWYTHITQAANELRLDIAKMNRLGATPKEFGLRVRAHPTSLIITARNKMKHSERLECWITLDGKFFETPRFKADIAAIRRNKVRADELVRHILTSCGNPIGSRNQPLFWTNVPADVICAFIRTYENHYLNVEADGETLEKYIKKNSRFSLWDVLVVKGNAEGYAVGSVTINPTKRPVLQKSGILSAYGGKMRIGTMGLTRHGLSETDEKAAANKFRDSKRKEYKAKYKEQAEEKLQRLSIPDRAYLIPGRKPILILHYLLPDFKGNKSNIPAGFSKGKDLMVGYGIGFPSLAGSEPYYAVYYVNTVKMRKDFEEEIEEDQQDDNEE